MSYYEQSATEQQQSRMDWMWDGQQQAREQKKPSKINPMGLVKAVSSFSSHVLICLAFSSMLNMKKFMEP
jgi:hypothetical protein